MNQCASEAEKDQNIFKHIEGKKIMQKNKKSEFPPKTLKKI